MVKRTSKPSQTDILLLVLPFLAATVILALFFVDAKKPEPLHDYLQIGDIQLNISNTTKESTTSQVNSEKISQLEKGFNDLKEKVKLETGFYGIYIKDRQINKEFKYNDSSEFYAASLYKIPIAAATMKEIERGKLDKDTLITYLPYDYSAGTGVISTYNYGMELKLSDVLTELLKNSDNTAQNMLLRTLLFKNAEETFKILVPDSTTSTFYRYNISTPYEISFMIERLYFGNYLKEENRNYIKDLLINTSFEDRITPHLASGTKFSHKIGSWPETWHDCGVVYANNHEVIVCLMSQRSPYESYLNVGKLVGEFVNKIVDDSPTPIRPQ